ncbi:hypothetical protein OBBRIDRAFT_450860 [Obba rivulosa]|uniref:DUF6534 domain-containing protein n=1 Tax=Obba rivulosa TaxID=1052685 RepID=A0A8E2B0D1_9APHY|nr:hypothetical protein OBBRIDRAFT_450860 [Obba rivulosa]
MTFLDGTLGVLQIASMITFILYGVTTIQTYIYFRRCARDHTFFKVAMTFLWVLDTLHQVFIGHAVYTYTVTDFSSILLLTQETWSLIAAILVTAPLEMTVRSMFCLRIWQLSGRNWILVSVIMLCSFGAFGNLIAFALLDRLKLHDRFLELRSLSVQFYLAVTCSISADSLIALTQVMLLWKRRSRFQRTNSVLRSLIIYSVNTGLLTTLCVLLLCITWAVLPNNLTYDIFFAAMPTLLFNSLLATLNARQELREMVDGNIEMNTIGLSTAAPSSFISSTGIERGSGDHQEFVSIPVMIKIERHEHVVSSGPEVEFRIQE